MDKEGENVQHSEINKISPNTNSSNIIYNHEVTSLLIDYLDPEDVFTLSYVSMDLRRYLGNYGKKLAKLLYMSLPVMCSRKTGNCVDTKILIQGIIASKIIDDGTSENVDSCWGSRSKSLKRGQTLMINLWWHTRYKSSKNGQFAMIPFDLPDIVPKNTTELLNAQTVTYKKCPACGLQTESAVFLVLRNGNPLDILPDNLKIQDLITLLIRHQKEVRKLKKLCYDSYNDRSKKEECHLDPYTREVPLFLKALLISHRSGLEHFL